MCIKEMQSGSAVHSIPGSWGEKILPPFDRFSFSPFGANFSSSFTLALGLWSAAPFPSPQSLVPATETPNISGSHDTVIGDFEILITQQNSPAI